MNKMFSVEDIRKTLESKEAQTLFDSIFHLYDALYQSVDDSLKPVEDYILKIGTSEGTLYIDFIKPSIDKIGEALKSFFDPVGGILAKASDELWLSISGFEKKTQATMNTETLLKNYLKDKPLLFKQIYAAGEKSYPAPKSKLDFARKLFEIISEGSKTLPEIAAAISFGPDIVDAYQSKKIKDLSPLVGDSEMQMRQIYKGLPKELQEEWLKQQEFDSSETPLPKMRKEDLTLTGSLIDVYTGVAKNIGSSLIDLAKRSDEYTYSILAPLRGREE